MIIRDIEYNEDGTTASYTLAKDEPNTELSGVVEINGNKQIVI